MLYPRSLDKELDIKLFENPTKEYRGAPFWSWNCHVSKELVNEQIPIFKEMGMGGFHMHPRIGFDTEYMSNEYLDLIKECNETAKKNDMLCWLYDEDGYPSGTAGGLAVSDIRNRARHILLTQEVKQGFCASRQEFESAIDAGESPAGYYLCSYSITLENGCLKEYSLVEGPKCFSQGNTKVWNAYLQIANNLRGTAYLDTMNPKAVKKFIDVTHENYYKAVGKDFGTSVPAIFTDEPHISSRNLLPYPDYNGDTTVSFTDDFSDTFEKKFGVPYLNVLPETLWELPDGKKSKWRYAYFDHLAERFENAYFDQIGQWCGEHNICFTGHLLSERTQFQQSYRLSEAMRHYKPFQLPGIDILCSDHEFSTAKQTVSVARQYGREGVISELYGVTHWYFDFKGHKLQGDWQAALGVTVRVPHLSWMTMEGIGKRDYPASIFYQSPWYKKYPFIENHFARLNTVLTRGKAEVKVGVIHPIESFWLELGPNSQTLEKREQMDENFESFIRWLLYGTIDFDFIAESLLPEQNTKPGCPLKVGSMEYDAVLVPDVLTLRSTTLDALEAFADAGGKVVFAGNIPEYVDAVPSDRAKKLAQRCVTTFLSRVDVLNALESERTVEIRDTRGSRSTQLIYQLRADNDDKWLFVCHTGECKKTPVADRAENYLIKINGVWNPVEYNTITGETRPLAAYIEDGKTVLQREMYAEDSLLVRLEKGMPVVNAQKQDKKDFQVVARRSREARTAISLKNIDKFELSEPNCVLLDKAALSVDGGKFDECRYILDVCSGLRSKMGYKQNEDPWLIKDNTPGCIACLKYIINSDCDLENVRLAMEHPEGTEKITLNGTELEKTDIGWYVDKAIRVIRLSKLVKGANELLITIPFGPKTLFEPVYLLGEFGANVSGDSIRLLPKPQTLVFGDITPQGLPFYAGNVSYTVSFTLDGDFDAVLEVPHFESPVLEAELDGVKAGLIAFAPHRLNLGRLSKGVHTIKLIAYGNRYNCFGSVHNADPDYKWYGPNAYVTFGGQWTDSYVLRPFGILDAPAIIIK